MQENRQISSYRQALKERILKTAMELFATYGVKAVKMDDIAASLGISKRTLYEIYENKEVLLFEGVKLYLENAKQKMCEFTQANDDVMDIVLYFYRMKNHEYQVTSPSFYEDIQKYPRVTAYLDGERQKNQEQQFAFMERGVAEGYFRDDVNYRVLNHFFEAMGNYVRDHQLIHQFTSDELFNNILFVTLRGICTPKGLAKMQENDAFL